MKIEFMGISKKYDFYAKGRIYSTYNGVDFYGVGLRVVKDEDLLNELREAYNYYV